MDRKFFLVSGVLGAGALVAYGLERYRNDTSSENKKVYSKSLAAVCGVTLAVGTALLISRRFRQLENMFSNLYKSQNGIIKQHENMFSNLRKVQNRTIDHVKILQDQVENLQNQLQKVKVDIYLK